MKLLTFLIGATLLIITTPYHCVAQMDSNYASYDNITMNFDSNGNLLTATLTMTLDGDTAWSGYPPCHHTGEIDLEFGGVYGTATVGPVWPNYYMDLSKSVTLIGPGSCFDYDSGCRIDQELAEVICTCDGPFYSGDGPHAGAVVPKVTVSLRAQNDQSVSSDNSARSFYVNNVHSTAGLGFFVQTLNAQAGGQCTVGNEMVGAIVPSTYIPNIQLHRTVLSEGCYWGTSPTTCTSGKTPPYPDDSSYLLRDDNPQSGNSGGKVYDLDAPGAAPFNVNVPYRWRVNFREYATMADGTTRVSPNLDYYVRISCQTDQNGNNNFNLDYALDDQIGTPCTATSADISGPCPQ